MITTISIFIFSLLGLGVLVFLKKRAIMKGALVPPIEGEAPENAIDALSFSEIENRLRVFGAHMGRKTVLWLLKSSIKISWFIRRRLDKIISKIHKLFEHHQEKMISGVRGKKSEFLGAIGNYKKEIGKHRQKPDIHDIKDETE